MIRPGKVNTRQDVEKARGLSPEEVLENGLSQHFARPVRIANIHHETWETSSHPIERWQLTLASGERLGVIYKRLLAGHKPHGNEREVLIYRRLLLDRRFGAPLVYASVYDDATANHWLFLEDVGEESLRDGDMQDWMSAIHWLAEMHGTYLGREAELRAARCLEEHAAPYYESIAQTARRHLERAGLRRVLRRFDGLMKLFDAVVAHLLHQPPTLVHGDVYVDNLIVQPGPRIRPVDWEAAAIGLAALDLVRLLDGWDKERPMFITAYLEELTKHTVTPLNRADFESTLACCGLINVLWHLGWDAEACRDTGFVDGLLNEYEIVQQILNI